MDLLDLDRPATPNSNTVDHLVSGLSFKFQVGRRMKSMHYIDIVDNFTAPHEISALNCVGRDISISARLISVQINCKTALCSLL